MDRGRLTWGGALVAIVVIPLIGFCYSIAANQIPASWRGSALSWAALAGIVALSFVVWRLSSGGREADLTSQVVSGEIPRKPTAFVARSTVMRLEAAASSRVPVVSVLAGPVGLGKTQVAAAYARSRCEAGWSLVAWVGAETHDDLLAGLARAAAAVGVEDRDGDSQRSAMRLRDFLETRQERGLIVFDNAVDPDGLRPFIPATGTTHVVITTTNQTFADWGEPVPLLLFSPKEAKEYLRARTGIDDDQAAEVAIELEYLPLALAQAAATISGQRLSYARYLELLGSVPVAVLLGRVPGDAYRLSTAAAILLSVDAVERAASIPEARRLLAVLAWMSPDGVRRDLLYGLTSADGKEFAQSAVDLVVGRAVDGSVLEWSENGDSVVMHRLVARIIRERDYASGDRDVTIDLVLTLLERHVVAPDKAWEQRELAATLVEHVEAVWINLVSQQDAALTKRVLALRAWASEHLRTTRDLTRAIALGRATLQEREHLLTRADPDLWASRKTLAYALLQAESPGKELELLNRDEGLELLKRTAIDIEGVFGKDSREGLTARKDLAASYRDADRGPEAVDLAATVLAQCKEHLPLGDPLTLSAASCLGAAYKKVGDHHQALPLYEQVWQAREEAGDPKALWALSNLASAFQAAGRPQEAIPLFQRVLDAEVGSDQPNPQATSKARANLALAYQAQGSMSHAISLLETSLDERLQAPGDEDPLGTLRIRFFLARAYEEVPQWDKAATQYEAMATGRAKILGPDHPDTTWALEKLAATQRAGNARRSWRSRWFR